MSRSRSLNKEGELFALAKNITFMTIGVSAIGLLVGCSSSGGSLTAQQSNDQIERSSSAADGSTGVGQAAPSETSDPTGSGNGDLASLWTATGTAPGGYTEEVSIAVGKPVRYSPNLDNNGVEIGDQCGGDQTTLVVPFSITSTNTTPSFPVTTEVMLVTTNADDITIESQFISGIECSEENDYVPVASMNYVGSRTPPNASTTSYGFIMLANYFSPSTPDGDQATLASGEAHIGVCAHQDGYNYCNNSSSDGSPTSSPSDPMWTLHLTGPGVDQMGTAVGAEGAATFDPFYRRS